ncbi:MAG: endonuclease/exonuclease/phosphatase family protein [Chloroflexota bacterium]
MKDYIQYTFQVFANLVSLGYITVLASLLIANAMLKSQFSVMALITTLNIFLFLPMVGVIIFAVLWRTKIGLLCALIGGALLYWYHPFIPQRPFEGLTTTEENQLKTLSFNLGWYTTPPDLLGQMLATQEADIVAVQEIHRVAIDLFGTQLAEQYPYQILDSNTATSGLLSKHPIIEYEWLYPEGGRAMLHAVIDWEGQPIHVYSVHLLPPPLRWYDARHLDLPPELNMDYLPRGLNEWQQKKETNFLINHAGTIQDPVIIMGDFNMSDQSESYALLRNHFRDAYRDGGWGLGFTFPNETTVRGIRVSVPLIRIDYIFYTHQLDIIESDVLCFPQRSDHCGITSSFALP